MTTPAALAALGPTAANMHDAFYADLTRRNRGLIDARDQQLLRRATILVAGCGSIGGAVVEPLVRLGAEQLILAEPDVYEVHNLNRQQARLADMGRNKALVLAERMREINPYADVRVDERGITADNVVAHAAAATVIFDGIDVTTRPALVCKHALHVQAHRLRVPVVCGYDIAGTQLVIVYDYRRGSLDVLDGRLSGQCVEELDPLRFLARVVPLRALPLEIFPILRSQLRGDDTGFPQLVYSAQMFGVLACRVGLDLLAGRPVRHRITVDVNMLTRPGSRRRRARWARAVELARMSRSALSYRR
jgi:molybdopterin/thiamine biosynthesis adenylyltransferase